MRIARGSYERNARSNLDWGDSKNRTQRALAMAGHNQAQDEYDGVKEVSGPLTLTERRKRLAAA